MPIELSTIKVPDEIPGFITHFELMCLANIAIHIPENKKILEIGSLFGRSATALLINSHENVTITCVDPFESFHDTKTWEKEHGDKLDGSDKDSIAHAVKLTREGRCFYDGFNYFTKKYQDNGRLKLIRARSLEIEYTEPVEVLFIDGDHFIAGQDFIRFYDQVEGLIGIHDYEIGTEWGQATIKSCMGNSYLSGIPYVIFPSASIAFFCKSEYWQHLIHKICADSLKHLKEFGENYEISKFFA